MDMSLSSAVPAFYLQEQGTSSVTDKTREKGLQITCGFQENMGPQQSEEKRKTLTRVFKL